MPWITSEKPSDPTARLTAISDRQMSPVHRTGAPALRTTGDASRRRRIVSATIDAMMIAPIAALVVSNTSATPGACAIAKTLSGTLLPMSFVLMSSSTPSS